MISLSAAASVLLYLIVGAIVFALMLYAVGVCEREFPQAAPWWKVCRILVVLMAVFVLIGALLSLVGGVQVFRP